MVPRQTGRLSLRHAPQVRRVFRTRSRTCGRTTAAHRPSSRASSARTLNASPAEPLPHALLPDDDPAHDEDEPRQARGHHRERIRRGGRRRWAGGGRTDEQRTSAGSGRFDAIVIETTGLADPAPVAQTFFVDDELKEQLYLDAILTVVDAKLMYTYARAGRLRGQDPPEQSRPGDARGEDRARRVRFAACPCPTVFLPGLSPSPAGVPHVEEKLVHLEDAAVADPAVGRHLFRRMEMASSAALTHGREECRKEPRRAFCLSDRWTGA